MRSVWSTLASILVLAGLAGYIFLVENKRESEAKEKVWSGTLAAADMEEVEIKLADGETARVQKADGTWQLVEPAKAPADQNELTSITTSLASLEVQRVVDPNAADVKQYGLEPARIAVAFRGASNWARKRQPAATSTRASLAKNVCSSCRRFSTLPSTRRRSPCATRPS